MFFKGKGAFMSSSRISNTYASFALFLGQLIANLSIHFLAKIFLSSQIFFGSSKNTGALKISLYFLIQVSSHRC